LAVDAPAGRYGGRPDARRPGAGAIRARRSAHTGRECATDRRAISALHLRGGGRTGHSVLRHEISNCARLAVDAFLSARVAAPCAERPLPPAPYNPANLSALSPVALRGRTGRTLAAVYLTLDALWRDRDYEFSDWYVNHRTGSFGGLRGGYASVMHHSIDMHAIETIRGVRLPGRVIDPGTGTLIISGRTSGRLTLTRGRVSGTLGGRRIRSRLQPDEEIRHSLGRS
jgi:hypothetical protein